ncbi:MAG: nucleoside-diphosphate kinase [Bacillota bacterium]
MEQSLVLVKPDGVEHHNIGEIITRFEKKGLKIQALKMVWIDEELAKEHYQEHQGKEFFARIVNYLAKGPVVAMVIAGEKAIAVIRNMAGATDPIEASPGTIRGDLAADLQHGNVIHASDSKQSAQREIDLYFDAAEIYAY